MLLVVLARKPQNHAILAAKTMLTTTKQNTLKPIQFLQLQWPYYTAKLRPNTC